MTERRRELWGKDIRITPIVGDESAPRTDAGSGTGIASPDTAQAGSVAMHREQSAVTGASAGPGPVARPAIIEVQFEMEQVPAGVLMLLMGPWTWKNWYMAELTDNMRWEDDGGPAR